MKIYFLVIPILIIIALGFIRVPQHWKKDTNPTPVEPSFELTEEQRKAILHWAKQVHAKANKVVEVITVDTEQEIQQKEQK